MKEYFSLFACCIPVKGARRSTICDLQRDDYELIPNILYYILTKQKNKKISEIKEGFNNQHDEEIDSYFDFLVSKQFGFYTNNIKNFPKINLNNFKETKSITNAIVDFNETSNHNLNLIIKGLSSLRCEALELRFYFSIDLNKLKEILQAANDSTLRSVEVVLGYHPSLTVDSIVKLHQTYPRVRKMTIHSSSYNKVYEHEEIFIIFHTDVVNSESCCGKISPWYFISNTQTFMESLKYNSCLNKKIAIDKNGEIKNCPSMVKSFGNVKSTELSLVLDSEDFRRVWYINKDKIKICKDCEFRHICQDCRAYVTNGDEFSKPLKCNYDPYEAIWK